MRYLTIIRQIIVIFDVFWIPLHTIFVSLNNATVVGKCKEKRVRQGSTSLATDKTQSRNKGEGQKERINVKDSRQQHTLKKQPLATTQDDYRGAATCGAEDPVRVWHRQQLQAALKNHSLLVSGSSAQTLHCKETCTGLLLNLNIS